MDRNSVIGKSGEDITIVYDGEEIETKGGHTLQTYIDNYGSMYPGMASANPAWNEEEKKLSFTKDSGTKGFWRFAK